MSETLNIIFPSRRRDDRIIMWGTTPPCAKLTGDSANGFEAALIGDCRFFRLSAENWSPGILRVLQHYPGSNGLSPSASPLLSLTDAVEKGLEEWSEQ